jgi:hypothetical protein
MCGLKTYLAYIVSQSKFLILLENSSIAHHTNDSLTGLGIHTTGYINLFTISLSG